MYAKELYAMMLETDKEIELLNCTYERLEKEYNDANTTLQRKLILANMRLECQKKLMELYNRSITYKKELINMYK